MVARSVQGHVYVIRSGAVTNLRDAQGVVAVPERALAARIERAHPDGQRGPDQVFGCLRSKLAEVLSTDAFTGVYYNALSAFQAATTRWLGWPLAENSRKTFSIGGPLEAISDAVPANNLERK